MKSTLENGERVGVVLGGVREMLETTNKKTTKLVIRSRKGVFRLALMTGVPLVPILSYGESDMFPPSENETIKIINTYLHKTIGLIVPVTSWSGLKNWMKLYYQPLDIIPTYIGEPISVEKIESPTEKDIANLRNRYIKEVTELFDRTKPDGYNLIIQE